MSGAISGTTLAVMAGVGAAGSLGGAAIASNAAGNAADTQANAADRSAQLQYQASQNALQFQEQQWQQQQQNLQPWLQSGTGALTNLDYLLGIGGNPVTAAQGGGQPASFQPGSSPQIGNYPGAGVKAQPIVSGPYSLNGGGGAPSFNPSQPSIGVQRPQIGNYPGAGATPQLRMAGTTQGGDLTPGGSTLAPGTHQFGVPGAPGAAGSAPPAGGMQGPPGMDGSGFGVNSGLGGYGSLMQPYQGHFTAPTNITEQNDPGFQARLNLGSQQLQQSAAARGNVLTGGTAKALDTYAQDYASNEYNNVYNRTYNGYATDYNQYQQGQTNQYNRLASLAGVGQQTASQLGMLGNQASQNVSSNLLGTAAGMGQAYQNAAAANASGMVGSANAWSGALGGTANNLSNLYMLSQLQNGGGGGGWGIGY